MTEEEARTEACGRCSMTTVVDAVTSDKPAAERAEDNPFDGERIEVAESELRRVSPAGWFANRKAELDSLARRIVYGR